MNINVENSLYGQKAKALFLEGYNCSQAVALAFADKSGIDEKTILKLSSSFGGGMGKLREVCGAVSGMFMVAGLLYGYEEPKDYEGKKDHYARIQELAAEYKKYNGSIVCKELLGLTKKEDSSAPEKRTEEYYKKRPCAELVTMAAAIMEAYMEENSVE